MIHNQNNKEGKTIFWKMNTSNKYGVRVYIPTSTYFRHTCTFLFYICEMRHMNTNTINKILFFKFIVLYYTHIQYTHARDKIE